MANHHCDSERATISHPIPGFKSPAQCYLKSGDEVFLKYGSHSNRFLFQHYGFVCEGRIEQCLEMDEAFDHVMTARSAESRTQIAALLGTVDYWR
jgi:hypothetical protein